MADNEKGLKDLMTNVKEYLDGEKDLVECLDKHQKICYQDIGGIDYFSDGWTKDTTLNLFKFIVKAVEGDSKAYSRLRVDLGIDDCNLTIMPMK